MTAFGRMLTFDNKIMDNYNYTNIECASWTKLPNAIKILSDTLSNIVIPNQNESNTDWDIIRIEIWEDTGRFIAFPAKRNSDERIDIYGTQIICKEISEEVNSIDHSNFSDDEHDVAIKSLVLKMANILRESMPVNIPYDYEIYNQDGQRLAV